MAERNFPNGTLYSTIKYTATLTPPDPGVKVFHKLFDPDDPTAQSDAVDSDPGYPVYPSVAANESNSDNRSAYPGDVESAVTDGAGKVKRIIKLPVACAGDNFRKVFALKQDMINAIKINVGPTSNATLDTTALGGNSGYGQTDLVTVWRSLHVEVDSMGPVAGNVVELPPFSVPAVMRVQVG